MAQVWYYFSMIYSQCWTEGQMSTAVAEDFRPTTMAMAAEV